MAPKLRITLLEKLIIREKVTWNLFEHDNIRVGTHFYLLRITYISGEKAGESTSAKDERIIMLHTMLLYSRLKPVLVKPLLYEEYNMNSY